MTPRRHLDDLFSAAYEDELSPIDEARFQAHMQSCAPCAAAYAEFRASIDALREVPKARMPHVVHLPSTPPVAERPSRPRIGMSWFNLGLVRRFPATAIAGGIAAVLVIAALVHGGAPTSSTTAGSAAGPVSVAHAPAVAPGSSVAETACTHTIVEITPAAPPSSFTHEDLATDAAQPAVHLVLAAPTLVVTAGTQAIVYAQLSVPVSSISNQGTAATALPARAVLPCVSIAVGSTNAHLSAIPASTGALDIPRAQGGVPNFVPSGPVGPLLSFQVPAGLARGTEIHVMATIPAGYAALGSPRLTAELTLTTR